MQKYMIRLNGGYNPFVQHGRGGLGYRPMRQIIGGMIKGDEEEGGGEGGETRLVSQYKPYRDEDVHINNTGDTSALDTGNLLLSMLEEKISKIGHNEEEEESKALEEEDKKLISKIGDIQLKSQKKRETLADNAIFEAGNVKSTNRNYINKLVKPIIIEKIEDEITLMNSLKNLNDKKSIMIKDNCTRFIDNALEALNEMYTKKQFEIKDNKVVEKSKTKKEGKLDFEVNIKTQEKATEIIKDYWDDNTEITLETNDVYGTKINKMIEKINETELLDDYMDEYEEEYKKAEKFSKKFPNEVLSEKYARTIKVDGKSKFYNSDGTSKSITKDNEVKSLFDVEYNSAGKAVEFSICGKDNPLAKQLYGVMNPNIQITDYIVEDIVKSGAGKYFCSDGVDIDNKFFVEMKKYDGYNYQKFYNLNIGIKETYFNKLKINFIGYIEDYTNEKNPKEKTKIYDTIKSYYKVLTNKDEFDKDFYKNRNYIGIGVTMNKFNPIIIPSDYNYNDSPSTEPMMKHVQESQGQKFIPSFTNKQITKVTCTPSGSVGYEKFNKDFNKLIKGDVTPYNFYITCVFSKTICVYNYTNDDFVENDFILGTYRCAYAHDSRDGTDFNAVLIPIEKFFLIN